jgi:hypothetical protein
VVAQEPPDVLVVDRLCACFGEFSVDTPVAVGGVLFDDGDYPLLELRIRVLEEGFMMASVTGWQYN